MADQLAKRGRALEKAFFAKRDNELLEALQKQMDAEALGELTGIDNPDDTGKLCDLGIGGETLAALGLAPLVEVAWADGRMEPNEKDAIVVAAHASGIKPGSASYDLLQQWLESKPGPELREGWKEYIACLASTMDVDTMMAIETSVLGRAETVAKSAGGVLGIQAISTSEQAVLTDLKSAF